MAGAPKGNDNAKKGRMWRDAIRYALARRGRQEDAQELAEAGDDAAMRGLRIIAVKFLEAVEDGGTAEFRELGDRIDGKAVQGVELSGPDGDAMEMKWTVEVVDAED